MPFLLYIILLFLFYILLMFFIHTIFHYIKNNYTTKKEVNLANIQQKKYQELAEFMKHQTPHQIPHDIKLFSNSTNLEIIPHQSGFSQTESRYLEDSLLQVLNENT